MKSNDKLKELGNKNRMFYYFWMIIIGKYFSL